MSTADFFLNSLIASSEGPLAKPLLTMMFAIDERLKTLLPGVRGRANRCEIRDS